MHLMKFMATVVVWVPQLLYYFIAHILFLLESPVPVPAPPPELPPPASPAIPPPDLWVPTFLLAIWLWRRY